MPDGVRSGAAQPLRLPGVGAGGPGSAPVSLRDGFLQFLPPKSLIFFQRPFFADYPRPLQIAGTAPYPRTIPIARIQAPARQAIIFRNSVFTVFKNTGIAPNDSIEVERTRVVGYFGFQTQLGQSGLTDFNTNMNPNGQVAPLVGANTSAQLGGAPVVSRPGQSNFYPFPGSAQAGLDNFAYYVRAGQEMIFSAIVLRAPPFEAARVSVEVTGYVVGETVLDAILTRLTSG